MITYVDWAWLCATLFLLARSVATPTADRPTTTIYRPTRRYNDTQKERERHKKTQLSSIHTAPHWSVDVVPVDSGVFLAKVVERRVLVFVQRAHVNAVNSQQLHRRQTREGCDATALLLSHTHLFQHAIVFRCCLRTRNVQRRRFVRIFVIHFGRCHHVQQSLFKHVDLKMWEKNTLKYFFYKIYFKKKNNIRNTNNNLEQLKMFSLPPLPDLL